MARLSFHEHPLFIHIETPAAGRGGRTERQPRRRLVGAVTLCVNFHRVLCARGGEAKTLPAGALSVALTLPMLQHQSVRAACSRHRFCAHRLPTPAERFNLAARQHAAAAAATSDRITAPGLAAATRWCKDWPGAATATCGAACPRWRGGCADARCSSDSLA